MGGQQLSGHRRHQGVQLFSSPENSIHHGSHWKVEPVGNFRILEMLEMVHFNHLLVDGRQIFNRGSHPSLVLQGSHSCVRKHGRAGDVGHLRKGAPSLAPKPVDEDVPGDDPGPRAEFPAWVVLVEPSQNANCGVLRNVVHHLGVASEPAGGPGRERHDVSRKPRRGVRAALLGRLN